MRWLILTTFLLACATETGSSTSSGDAAGVGGSGGTGAHGGTAGVTGEGGAPCEGTGEPPYDCFESLTDPASGECQFVPVEQGHPCAVQARCQVSHEVCIPNGEPCADGSLCVSCPGTGVCSGSGQCDCMP